MASISVRKLTKKFGKIVAVDNISFDVEEGEIFGFLGPNSAGKSTTIKMLTCQLKPTSGEIRILGFDILKDCKKLKKMIGIAPQECNLHELLTGRQNLRFYGTLYEVPKKQLESRIDHYLQILEIDKMADRLVQYYSGGIKRRLSILLSVIHDPQVIFLDEPTAGLDPHVRHKVWKFIKNLKSLGKTVFLSTHHMEEADRLCDRIAIINHGRIVAIGSPTNLKNYIVSRGVIEAQISYYDGLLDEVRELNGVIDVSYDKNLKIVCTNVEAIFPEFVNIYSTRGLKSIKTLENTLENVFLTLTKNV